jgi:hypothetical protein
MSYALGYARRRRRNGDGERIPFAPVRKILGS